MGFVLIQLWGINAEKRSPRLLLLQQKQAIRLVIQVVNPQCKFMSKPSLLQEISSSDIQPVTGQQYRPFFI
jgi:hypothetical protein